MPQSRQLTASVTFERGNVVPRPCQPRQTHTTADDSFDNVNIRQVSYSEMATLRTSDTDTQAIGVKFEGESYRKWTRQLPTRRRPNRSVECGEGAGERSSHVVYQFRNVLRRASPPVRHGHEYIADGSRVQ